MAIVNTMPMPEKMAPATKYGGENVGCHPRGSALAKAKDTTAGTESTSGGGEAARNRYARVKCRHSRSEFRHPNESAANTRLRMGFVSRSLSTAMSGMRPTYRNVLEIVK